MFKRSAENPILLPNEKNTWEESKVYNPAVLYEGGFYHLFYRAVGKEWISSIGHAISKDGERFTRDGKPILAREYEYESRGVEDPRIVKIGDTYYMTYTVYDGTHARLSLATSDDLKRWTKHGILFKNWNYKKTGGLWYFLYETLVHFRHPKDWSKAGGIFPAAIGGTYWMLFGDSKIWLAHSDDGVRWTPRQEPMIFPRSGHFDNRAVEMRPPPIKTEKGWLVFYHGVDEKLVYRIGFLILALHDPSRILYRSEKPIFEPSGPHELRGIVDILPGGYRAMEKMNEKELGAFVEKWEKKGKMPHVAFCCGAVAVNGMLRIYYGASDSVICTATARLNDILSVAG